MQLLLAVGFVVYRLDDSLVQRVDPYYGRIHTAVVERAIARCTMRAELIGHFKPCITEIYLHIVARMAD